MTTTITYDGVVPVGIIQYKNVRSKTVFIYIFYFITHVCNDECDDANYAIQAPPVPHGRRTALITRHLVCKKIIPFKIRGIREYSDYWMSLGTRVRSTQLIAEQFSRKLTKYKNFNTSMNRMDNGYELLK